MVCLAFAESIQLVPDGTIFLHIGLILVMVFLLNRILFKPVNNVLTGRERRTHGRSEEAHNYLRQVEESLSKYERTLREARVESYQLLERQRTEVIDERRQRLSGVRQEIDDSIQNQKQEIQRQADEARLSLENEARRVAAEVSSHILRRPVGEASQLNTRI